MGEGEMMVVFHFPSTRLIVHITPEPTLNTSLTLSNATVQQNAPREPHGRRQVQCIFLRVLGLGQLKATKGREAVQQVQNKGDNMYREANQDPQSVLKWLEKGC